MSATPRILDPRYPSYTAKPLTSPGDPLEHVISSRTACTLVTFGLHPDRRRLMLTAHWSMRTRAAAPAYGIRVRLISPLTGLHPDDGSARVHVLRRDMEWALLLDTPHAHWCADLPEVAPELVTSVLEEEGEDVDDAVKRSRDEMEFVAWQLARDAARVLYL